MLNRSQTLETARCWHSHVGILGTSHGISQPQRVAHVTTNSKLRNKNFDDFPVEKNTENRKLHGIIRFLYGVSGWFLWWNKQLSTTQKLGESRARDAGVTGPPSSMRRGSSVANHRAGQVAEFSGSANWYGTFQSYDVLEAFCIW